MQAFFSLITAAGLVFGAGSSQFTVEPPPGWDDVTGTKNTPDLVAALKGPESSSFMLARVAATPLDNRGAIRAFLLDVLTELNKKSNLGFAIKGNVEEVSYDNGAVAHFIRADLQGKPRLILAVIDLNGAKFLGTLNSAVPDTLLPSIIGSLKDASSSARPSLTRQAQSLDGQLAFALPAGLASRSLSEREKKLNFVLAVQGLGSELMIMKMIDDTTPIKDQPALVRGTVAAVDGVQVGSLSEPQLLETVAGPDLVYASARVRDASGEGQFAAGYMPWCYWSYSILAKGPRALDLMNRTFETISLGPDAQPKLVRETPQVPMPHELRLKALTGRKRAAVVAGIVAVLLVVALSRRRKGT